MKKIYKILAKPLNSVCCLLYYFYKSTNISSSHPKKYVAIQLSYTIIFLLIFIYFSGIYLNSINGKLLLEKRVELFKINNDDYDVIFVGDSRTYCGIHTKYLNKYLKMRSINLSSFSHWFPTQFAQFRDMGASLSQKTVVWSIGHQNFLPGTIQYVYPLDIITSLQLYFMDLTLPGFWNETFRSHTLSRVFSERAHLRARFENYFQLPETKTTMKIVNTPKFPFPTNLATTQQTAQAIINSLKGDTTISSIEQIFDNSILNSIVLIHENASYERIELIPEYFRWQQSKFKPGYSQFRPDGRMLELFDSILMLFKSFGVNLIVNELEEACFMYESKDAQYKVRKFMHDEIQPRVEKYGFSYIRTDLDILQADDYFDYNHMNSKGIAKYTPMLAEALRPFVEK